MAYTKPTRALALLEQVKSLIVEGNSTTDVDAMISAAQTEVDSEASQKIQDDFTAACLKRLRDCDWTQLDDAGLSAGAKTAWDTYRADLKALTVPTTQAELDAVVWPTEPS